MSKNQIYWIPLWGLLVAFVFSCQPKTQLSPGEGFVQVTGGKVWYRVVGEGAETPVLLLHGGPGFPSYYLNPLSALSKDRPVIFLDQLGCGRSDKHTDTTLMTVDIFVEQLEQFTAALGLDEFYLYGHSWGTMLGIDYYLKYPEKVKAIIFASPALSVPKWVSDCKVLIRTLPDSVQTAIENGEKNKQYDSPEYQDAINVFYQNFLARKLPWDPNMDSTFARANFKMYSYMWGPSEFTSTGILKNYDRADRLEEIKVPVLFMCGEFDEALPSTVQYFQSLTPGAKFEMVANAAHITMHDNPEQNVSMISEFLNGIDDL